jgi:hypothetical protein
MKNVIAAALAATGLILTAGTAHANPPVIYGDRGDRNADAYAAELVAQGLGGGSANAAKVAAVVCDKMTSRAPAGSTEAQMVAAERDVIAKLRANAWANGRRTVADDQAWYIVFGAEYHFCPEYN